MILDLMQERAYQEVVKHLTRLEVFAGYGIPTKRACIFPEKCIEGIAFTFYRHNRDFKGISVLVKPENYNRLVSFFRQCKKKNDPAGIFDALPTPELFRIG